MIILTGLHDESCTERHELKSTEAELADAKKRLNERRSSNENSHYSSSLATWDNSTTFGRNCQS